MAEPKRGITILTHRRAGYLSQTLDALNRCHGIKDWRVTVAMDRPDEETERIGRWLDPWQVVTLNLGNPFDPPYARVSRATLMTLALGFATADFVAHLEEDCIPAPDFLEYMAEMDRRYRLDRRVFSVSAWWPAPPDWGDDPPADAHYQTALDHIPDLGIATWGIGTWIDRWPEVRAEWDLQHWDRNLARRDRLTVHPLVSRVKNIGRVGTQPTSEYDWRTEVQSPAFLPHAPAEAWHQAPT